jgi:LSD1 subclass zinc finger protein
MPVELAACRRPIIDTRGVNTIRCALCRISEARLAIVIQDCSNDVGDIVRSIRATAGQVFV